MPDQPWKLPTPSPRRFGRVGIEYDRLVSSSKGSYTADRAAALSGVPKSTVHYWARNAILTPSVSAERVKLWSYPDLMALRIIYWLRHGKTHDSGAEVPPSTMPRIREALAQLQELDLTLWTEEDGPSVTVDLNGNVLVASAPAPEAAKRQRTMQHGVFDVLAPLKTETALGPNLHRPSAKIRIVPGKLGGAPHLVGTRLESQALASLAFGGVDTPLIYKLYPDFDSEAIDQAIVLETQLAENIEDKDLQPAAG